MKPAMYALLAPGQGAQTPRMLRPWLRDPRYSAISGMAYTAGSYRVSHPFCFARSAASNRELTASFVMAEDR